MADEPARLVLLDEEREGEQIGSDDFVFRRIGESVPLFADQFSFDLQSPPFKPLSISNLFGALFIAHSEGFLVVKTKDAIHLAKEVKEKGKGPCLNNSIIANVQIGRVSLLEMSSDSSMLATVIGGDIYFFSISSLLKKDQKPVFSRSLIKSGVVKDFKWLNKDSKSYIVLSDSGLLYQGDFKGELEDVLDSVDAVDCSPDGKSIAVLRKKSWSIYSSNFEESLRMPLSFESWPDSESIKMDSIGWVRDDSIIIGATQLNDNQDEEGYLVQVITSGDKNFLERSCKPVAFSFPYLFEDLSDYIIPSGFGPHLLLSYLDRWGVLLVSNKKNIDQHVVLLKWNFNEGKSEINSLEFQNDKYIPRIDLQENGDDNTVVGFGVEKVSLFEKITIQSGTEMQELAPQFIMACLTCEGKLTLYHIARASDPSELPQINIPDFEALESKPNLLENDIPSASKQSDVNNTQVSLTELADLATTIKGEEELEVKNNNQVKMVTPQPGPTTPSLTFTETKILESKIPETKIPNEASSPFKCPFGTSTQNAPRFTLTETKAQSETSSPFKSPFSSNSPFEEIKKEQSQTSEQSQSLTGGFDFGTQNAPTTLLPFGPSSASSETSSPFKVQPFGSKPFSLKPFGTFDSTQKEGSKPFGADSTPQKEGFKLFGTNVSPQKEGSIPFGTDSTPQKEGSKPFGQSNTPSETSSPFKVQPFGFAQSSLKPFGTVDSAQKEGSKPFGTINSTQKEGSKPFDTVDSMQKEGSKPFGTVDSTQKEGLKPLGTIDSTQKEGSKPFGTNLTPPKEASKPFGTNLTPQKEESKLFGTSNSTPQKEGFTPFSGSSLKLGSPMPSSDLNKTSENKILFPKQNADKKPGKFEERELSNKREKLKREKESEQDLSNKFYSVKDITNDLERLLSAIEKEVGFTSQQNILLELDQNLKTLSKLSLECKSNVEEQLEMMQDLRDKMSQVSSRQVYMESIVNQSSDKRYWDVWNSQKLPSEFEIKRQNILKTNQNLTSHLVELERHFNTLEINEFGEANRVGFNRRNISSNSRPTQSIHSVYNTLNSQMATAEQLSEHLSKQISMLKITSSPSPPVSKRAGSVKKLLFESIGLSYEPDDNSYRSPEFPKSGAGSSSSSVKTVKTKTFSESKRGSEIQTTARRRRDSLDRSWSSVEPQKTTVKRIPSVEKQQPSSSQKRFSIGSDKKLKSNREIIKKETEPIIAHQSQTGRFGVSISSPPFLESSVSNFDPPTQAPASPPQQQSSVFKWVREISSSSQNTEPKSQEPPKISPSFQSTTQTSPSFAKPFSSILPPVESTVLDAKSQTGQPPFGSKTGEGTFKPPVFNFPFSNTSAQSTDASSTKTAPSIFGKSTEQDVTTAKPTPSIFGKSTEPEPTTAKPSPSIFGKSTEPEATTAKPAPSIFGKSTEQESATAKPAPSIFGKPNNEADGKDNKTSTETVPALSKTVPSFFQPSATPTFGELKLGTGSPEKTVQVSVPAPVSSPPKPVPTTLSFSPPKPVPTISSPPKPVPTVSFSPLKPVPEPSTIPSSSPVSSPVQTPPIPSSNSFTTPSVSSPVQLTPPITTPQKDEEDEMEEEITDTSASSLNFGSLSGFGSGPAPTSNQPKPNPFGPSLFNSPSPNQTLNPPALTPSPGSLFRPPTLSFPSSQPSQQPSPPGSTTTTPFSGSGFTGFGQPSQIGSSGFGQPAQVGSGFGQPTQVGSGGFGQPAQVGSGGFGQPAQIGAGQQVLGSVLGSFGQSRQFGAGFNTNSGSGFGMPSPAPSSGGFGGFASAATGGGFASAATGGGFASAATGGGFAAAATGGGFAGATGGGFAGFGAGSQSGGFGGGGFGGVSNQGSGFSSFGGTGPGRPPAELFSQMRK